MRFQYEEGLREALRQYFETQSRAYVSYHPSIRYGLEQLSELVLGGKLHRGSLFLEGFSFSEILPKYWYIAMAIELTHTAFLIHDDIMDESLERRGRPTLQVSWARYRAANGDEQKFEHYGLSQAICIGDLAIFLAQGLLTKGPLSPELWGILQFIQQEWEQVCLGQILDVDLGSRAYSEDFSVQEIFDIYEKKTARYTFSFPLICFALCQNWGSQEQDILSNLGRDLGILFQIRDDYLDIFGDYERLKKYPGQDVKEKKKTLHLCFLYRSLDQSEQLHFSSISERSGNLTPEDLSWIRESMKRLKIEEQILEYTQKLNQSIRGSLDNLQNPTLLPILEQIFEDVKKR